jgi:hypothetical protein
MDPLLLVRERSRKRKTGGSGTQSGGTRRLGATDESLPTPVGVFVGIHWGGMVFTTRERSGAEAHLTTWGSLPDGVEDPLRATSRGCGRLLLHRCTRARIGCPMRLVWVDISRQSTGGLGGLSEEVSLS